MTSLAVEVTKSTADCNTFKTGDGGSLGEESSFDSFEDKLLPSDKGDLGDLGDLGGDLAGDVLLRTCTYALGSVGNLDGMKFLTNDFMLTEDDEPELGDIDRWIGF